MVLSYCYYFLTKKYKLFLISYNSLMIIGFIGYILYIIFGFIGILISLFMLILSLIMEYIDEDIYSIIQNKFSLKSKKYYA